MEIHVVSSRCLNELNLKSKTKSCKVQIREIFRTKACHIVQSDPNKIICDGERRTTLSRKGDEIHTICVLSNYPLCRHITDCLLSLYVEIFTATRSCYKNTTSHEIRISCRIHMYRWCRKIISVVLSASEEITNKADLIITQDSFRMWYKHLLISIRS